MTTLLPYIISRNNTFPIKLSLVQETSESVPRRFPFVVISESGTFTRILKAEIQSDHGSTVKPVFLLMGKDQYLLTGSEQDIPNNEDVDHCWQRAYRHFSKESRLITLSEQTGQDSRIEQFQSLFFCRETQVFFHPPCPKCGKNLELCTDDDLLNSFGLQPYTKTLGRFLYCADCLQNKSAVDFYAYAPDTTDTVIVKDLHHLIDGFGSLKQTSDDGFPCLKCPLLNECYTGNNLAQTRVVPFSFYPFHLFVLESASINATDFLALVSGATLEDIKAGMSKKSLPGRLPFVESVSGNAAKESPFLFEKDPRFFLEILYLKLSFLGQLARIVFFDIDSYRHPDLDISLDSIWVNLPGKDSLLPFFWNFNINLIDIGQFTMPNPNLPKMPPSYGSYLLGIVWFRTLLSNAVHSPAKIDELLAKCLDHTDPLNPVVDETLVLQEHSHLFSSNNIFWNPGETEPAQEWSALWEDALGLGWVLLKNSASGGTRLSENDFWQAFDKLRQQIRDCLFMPAAKVSVRDEDLSHDSAIHAILAKILDQWSSSGQALPEDIEDIDETVIISGKSPEGPVQPELEETVILSPAGQPLDQRASLPVDEEDVLETIILSAEDVPAVQPPTIEDELAETVIIKPDQKTPDKATPPIQSDNAPEDIDDDLEATVILKKDSLDETIIMKKDNADQGMNTSLQQSSSGNSGDREDLLEETVIIRPDKDKG